MWLEETYGSQGVYGRVQKKFGEIVRKDDTITGSRGEDLREGERRKRGKDIQLHSSVGNPEGLSGKPK